MKTVVSILFTILICLAAAKEVEPNNLFTQANEFPAGIASWARNRTTVNDLDWFVIPATETLDGTARFSVSYNHESGRRGSTGHVSLKAFLLGAQENLTLLASTGENGIDDRHNEHELSFEMKVGESYLLQAVGTSLQGYTLKGCSPGTRYGPSEGISNEELLSFVNAYRVSEGLEAVASMAVFENSHFIENDGKFHGVLIVRPDATETDGRYAIACEHNWGRPWSFSILPWEGTAPPVFEKARIGRAPNGSLFILGESSEVYLWKRQPNADWVKVDFVSKTLISDTIFGDLELAFTPESFPITAFANEGIIRSVYQIRIGSEGNSIDWDIPIHAPSGKKSHIEILPSQTPGSYYAISFVENVKGVGRDENALAIWRFSESEEPVLIDSLATSEIVSEGEFDVSVLEAITDSAGVIHIALGSSQLASASIWKVQFEDNQLTSGGKIADIGDGLRFIEINALKNQQIKVFYLDDENRIGFSEFDSESSTWAPHQKVFTSLSSIEKPITIFSGGNTNTVRGFAEVQDGNLMLYPHFDLSDQDGDGRSALQELAEGTHPNKVDSVQPPSFHLVEHDGEMYPGLRFHRAEGLTFSPGGIYRQGSVWLLVESSPAFDESDFLADQLYSIEFEDQPSGPGQTLSTIRSGVPLRNTLGLSRLFYRTRILRAQ